MSVELSENEHAAAKPTEQERVTRERIRRRDSERARRQTPDFKRWYKQYHARPEVKERRRQYYARPEVKERIKQYYARPEVKERIKQYYAFPKRKSRREGAASLWGRRYHTLCRILALERLWEDVDYEFPFNFGGRYASGELPPQHTSDLLNGQETLFVSNGNGHLKSMGACYETFDDLGQDALNEARKLRHAVSEMKGGKHAGKYRMQPKRPSREPQPPPRFPPAPKSEFPRIPPPLRTMPIAWTWVKLCCPVCAELFDLPAPLVNKLRLTGERFTCPRGDLLYF